MSCFPCFRSQKSIKSLKANGNPGEDAKAADTRHKGSNGEDVNQGENGNIAAQTFTFRELATATKNFRQECLLGEGGFGRVYKGTLAPTGKVVAVKQLDRHGSEGNKDFLDEVSIISLLKHENLVKLVGYCADGDQRVLVYEFMPGGTLENHLLDIPPEKKPLDWFTRMKILFGAAQALEYLHDQANPPGVYRDLKTSNILLDGELNPKLSGLAKPSRAGDNMQIASRVMGTYGYCAPEYQASGDLTSKSDVYSFGVIFLEVITGRRAIDTTRPNDEQNLVVWAQPMFRDAKQFPDLADPLLEKRFPEKDLNQAVATAAMCLQEEPAARPLMRDIVAVLSFLSMEKEIIMPTPKPPATPTLEERVADHDQQENKAEDSSDSESSQDEASDREDAQIGNHQIHYVKEHDGDTSHHHNDDHSDSEDGDSVDMEDGEAEDDYHYSNSYSKRQVNSIMNSMSDRNSSNLETSSRSHGRRVSLGRLDSGGSQDGSISSSENSSRGSQGCDAFLSQKSNKVSRHARSRKSTRKSEGRSGSTSRRSSRKSRTKRTRHDDSSDQGSQDGSISSNHSSTRGSEHGNNHLYHTNSGGSEDGIVHLL